MTKKRYFSDVKFIYRDSLEGTTRTVTLWTKTAEVVVEGFDLDMVTAAFFHLFGHTVSPGIKHYGLREYKNGAVTHIVDDRLSTKRRQQRQTHPLSWSLMVSDDRPGELRLWVEATTVQMHMILMMDKKTTTEFGRQLAKSAGWEIAA
jgi:predicted secreted protein